MILLTYLLTYYVCSEAGSVSSVAAVSYTATLQASLCESVLGVGSAPDAVAGRDSCTWWGLQHSVVRCCAVCGWLHWTTGATHRSRQVLQSHYITLHRELCCLSSIYCISSLLYISEVSYVFSWLLRSIFNFHNWHFVVILSCFCLYDVFLVECIMMNIIIVMQLVRQH